MIAQCGFEEGEAVELRDALDERRFGGKSVNLGAMLRGDLPVPGGVALSWAFARAVSEGRRSAVERLLALGDRMPGLLAVRSSAVGEDAADASFAGQHLTVLGVQGAQDLVAAVLKVERSGAALGALAYRAAKGDLGEARVAVTVQRLLDPEAAGVLFSRNPVSGADERLVEAAWGLGEAVVSSRVTPDSYRVQPGGALLDCTPGDKLLSLHPLPGGGIEERRPGAGKARQLCLAPADLVKLDQLAQACEAQFGGPQDIEWAKADDRIWLLQSRPITAMARGEAVAIGAD
jgi:pyruvate,water dikinase